MEHVYDKVIWFSKVENGAASIRKVEIYQDGSAAIMEGESIEYGCEGSEDAWRGAIGYLLELGYSECAPPVEK